VALLAVFTASAATTTGAQFAITYAAFLAVRRLSNLPVVAQMTVGEDGNVRSFQMLHGSGARELDDWVEGHLVRGRYAAALVDGVPVIGDLELSLPIRTR